MRLVDQALRDRLVRKAAQVTLARKVLPVLVSQALKGYRGYRGLKAL